jgi:hypothetical protein
MSQTLELTSSLRMDDLRSVLRAIAASDEPEREVRMLGLGMDGLPELVAGSTGILSPECTVWDEALPLVLTQPYQSVGGAENGLLVFWDLLCRNPHKSSEASEVPLSSRGFRRFSVALALLNRIQETEIDWRTVFD